MHYFIRMSPRSPRLAAWLGLVLSLLLLAAFAPLDHDEGQYVGAVAWMRHGLPYRDFAYLQTPLQPLLLAPLAWLAEAWLFPALRAANALLAAGAVACIWLAARRAGASPRGAIVAAAALASSHMLLFAGSVARNDALPLLLTTAGLAVFLTPAGMAPRRVAAFIAGLLLAAAASAKISYGLPAAAVGLFALLHRRTLGIDRVMLLALGGLGGGLPTMGLAWLAPDAAWFGIIDYSLRAPQEWRIANDQAFMLAWPLSLARLVRFLAQGCGLIALVAVLAVVRRRRTMVERLLDMMILAGLLAAWLPRPLYVQYLGPLLPALFVRFALLTDAPFWRRPTGRALIAAGIIAGLGQSLVASGANLVAGRSPLFAVASDARAADDILTAEGLSGPIATLSPERAVGLSLPLDRRFVTGPFLFRTRSLLSDDRLRALHATNIATMAQAFDAMPPVALLIGGETERSRLAPRGLDAPLADWARAHHYRAVLLPSGRSTLLLRPPPARRPARPADRPHGDIKPSYPSRQASPPG